MCLTLTLSFTLCLIALKVHNVKTSTKKQEAAKFLLTQKRLSFTINLEMSTAALRRSYCDQADFIHKSTGFLLFGDLIEFIVPSLVFRSIFFCFTRLKEKELKKRNEEKNSNIISIRELNEKFPSKMLVFH